MQTVPAPSDLSHYDTQVEPYETAITAAENATLNAGWTTIWFSGQRID